MDFARKVVNTAGATFIVRILGLAGSVVLGRLLGPEGLGVYSILRAIPSFLVALTCVGLPTAAVYYVSREPQNRPQITATLFFYAIVCGSIIAIGLWISSPLLNKLYFKGVLKGSYFVLLSFLVPFMLFVRLGSAILQGLYRITERNGVEILLRTVLILGYLALVWLVKWHIFGALTSLVIAHCLTAFYVLFFVRRDIKFTVSRNFAIIRRMFGYALSAFLGQFLEQMEGNIIFLILGMFIESASLGLFAVAIALGGFVLFPSTAIARPMLPRLARMDEKEAGRAFIQVIQVGLILSTLTAVAVVVIAPYAVPLLYGSKFNGVTRILIVLLPGFIAGAMLSFVRVYFLSTGKPLWRMYMSMFRAVLLLVSIVVGGISGGILGAAIGMTVGLIITLFGALCFIFWYNPIIEFRDMIVAWTATVTYVKAFIGSRKR